MHIYRELNEEADSLSKHALAYQPRLMDIEEVVEGVSNLRYEAIYRATYTFFVKLINSCERIHKGLITI